jgi:hypothetical protein
MTREEDLEQRTGRGFFRRVWSRVKRASLPLATVALVSGIIGASILMRDYSRRKKVIIDNGRTYVENEKESYKIDIYPEGQILVDFGFEGVFVEEEGIVVGGIDFIDKDGKQGNDGKVDFISVRQDDEEYLKNPYRRINRGSPEAEKYKRSFELIDKILDSNASIIREHNENRKQGN